MFSYFVKESTVRNYYYIIEREADDFGTTERAASAPIHREALVKFRDEISEILEDD